MRKNRQCSELIQVMQTLWTVSFGLWEQDLPTTQWISAGLGNWGADYLRNQGKKYEVDVSLVKNDWPLVFIFRRQSKDYAWPLKPQRKHGLVKTGHTQLNAFISRKLFWLIDWPQLIKFLVPHLIPKPAPSITQRKRWIQNKRLPHTVKDKPEHLKKPGTCLFMEM